MSKKEEDKKSIKALKCNDYLANERTFLSWIRTSLGIMAFGFVIERFSLFLRQISLFLKADDSVLSHLPQSSVGYSSIFGVFVVALGTMIGVLSFIKYKSVEKQIQEDRYSPSLILDIMLTLLVLLIGAFMTTYLIHTL